MHLDCTLVGIATNMSGELVSNQRTLLQLILTKSLPIFQLQHVDQLLLMYTSFQLVLPP
jgi:hypothetical protein